MRYSIYVLPFLLIFSCSSESSNEPNELNNSNSPEVSLLEIDTVLTEENQDVVNILVSDTKGFVVQSGDMEYGEILFIRNFENEIIDTFIVEEKKTLVFPCYGREADRFMIQHKQDTGYILKDVRIEFQTWTEHLLSATSISFDSRESFVYESASIESTVIPYELDEFYTPVEVNSEWLKVQWGYAEPYNYGWIIWDNRDTLNVEMHYFF